MLRTLARERRGNAAIMLAGGLSALLATASLGIDAGTMFLEKRRLQGIADAAALAALGDPARARARADALVAATPGPPATLAALETGSYAADPAVAPADRFVADGGQGAVRATITGSSPSFFARALGFRAATPITARATAARIDMAAFSIGSRAVGIDGGLANTFLSALAGSDLRLSVFDYNTLINTRVDLFRFADALRTDLRLDGASFDTVLASSVTLPQFLRAAAAASDPAAAAVLRTLAGRVPATPFRVADIVDLGPSGHGLRADLAPPVAVDTLALLRAALEVAGGPRQIATDLDLGIPGLASTRLRLAIGARAAHSPWLAIGSAGQPVVRTAQARMYLDIQLAGAAPLGLGPVRVPFYIELAPAEARLKSVTCVGHPPRPAVTLAATPSLARIAIADLDLAGLPDFAISPLLRPATLVRVPLVSVTGYAEQRLGARTRDVVFDAAAITAHDVETVSSDDLVTSLAASLVGRLSLTVSIAGFGFTTGAVTAALGPVLTAAAPPLDLALNKVTALTGFGIGQADLWVDGIRCGTPVLVG